MNGASDTGSTPVWSTTSKGVQGHNGLERPFLYHLLEKRCTMELKLNKKILILSLKIALGSSAAMLIAQTLQLQNAASAGIIALLTIVTTKWETVKLSIARIITFLIAVVLSLLLFSNSASQWEIYGIYIFFLVIISEMLGFKSTISVNAVIGTHFLISRDFTV